MKLAIKALAALLISTSLIACKPQESGSVTIGIIEPLEHKAMDEIIAGFTATMKTAYKKPVHIKVENAQNDLNIQRTIIQKMHDANYDVIVPIGEGASQMAVALAKNQQIVSLASNLSDSDRKKLKSCHLAIVHDEISAKKLLQFIHTVYPNIQKISLVHSSADKVFLEVTAAIAAGKEYGITVKHVMVSSLPELNSVAQSLPADTQSILILKDSLIASGISTLSKVATERHISLITSDEGSVQNGAAFSLGVHERQIGVEGAKLVAAVLNGEAICNLPIVNMNQLTVFVNPFILKQETQDITAINNAANQLGYQTEVTEKGEM
jgi:putative ABC transport system substrate-binding protein